jgi:hypothetical protein
MRLYSTIDIARPKTLIAAVVLWTSVLVIGSARAAHEHDMMFQGYPPPIPTLMGTAWTIFGEGVIRAGTSERLQQFVNEHDVPYSSNLYLNSPGGSLTEAIKLGRLIRFRRLFTTVGTPGGKLNDIRPGECYSACAIAFLGGLFRFGHEGSSYGVHRFYASIKDTPLTSDDAQIVSAVLVDYIREMGVNASLFSFMTEAGPDEIKLLSDGDQVRLNVTNNGQGPTSWSVESLQGALYLKGARDTWRGMNKFLIICAPRTGLFLQIHYNAERRGEAILKFPTHWLVIDGEYPKPIITPIASLRVGQTALNAEDVISTTYRLTPEIVQKISRARSVGIAMKASEDAKIFMGFYGMDFSEGATKLPGLVNTCSGPSLQ